MLFFLLLSSFLSFDVIHYLEKSFAHDRSIIITMNKNENEFSLPLNVVIQKRKQKQKSSSNKQHLIQLQRNFDARFSIQEVKNAYDAIDDKYVVRFFETKPVQKRLKKILKFQANSALHSSPQEKRYAQSINQRVKTVEKEQQSLNFLASTSNQKMIRQKIFCTRTKTEASPSFLNPYLKKTELTNLQKINKDRLGNLSQQLIKLDKIKTKKTVPERKGNQQDFPDKKSRKDRKEEEKLNIQRLKREEKQRTRHHKFVQFMNKKVEELKVYQKASSTQK